MKKKFTNASQVHCVFTDDGITFYDPLDEIFYPYGSIEGINMSLMGVFQVSHMGFISTFTTDNLAQRREIREMIRYTKKAMKEAPKCEPVLMDVRKVKLPAGLSVEEQLAEHKSMYVHGVITKDMYQAKKRLLTD